MVRRALRVRCPWCGARKTFVRTWLGKYPRCRTCGIRWRREEGFELGPLALNTFVTFLVLAIAMTIGFIQTSPDIPVAPLVFGLVAIAVLLPVVLYPITFTVWLAFDLAVHRPAAAELAEAAAAVRESSQGA